MVPLGTQILRLDYWIAERGSILVSDRNAAPRLTIFTTFTPNQTTLSMPLFPPIPSSLREALPAQRYNATLHA
jgi:hypothetical protein